MTPSERKKILWLNLQRTVDKRGRTGKKDAGDTLQGADTRMNSINVTVMSKKGRQFFRKKNWGDTVSCHPG